VSEDGLSRREALLAFLGLAGGAVISGCVPKNSADENYSPVEATAIALGAEGFRERLAELNPALRENTISIDNSRVAVGQSGVGSGMEGISGGGTGFVFYQERQSDGKFFSMFVSSRHGNNQWIEEIDVSQPHLRDDAPMIIKDTSGQRFWVFDACGDIALVVTITNRSLVNKETDFIVPIKKDIPVIGETVETLGFPDGAPSGFVTGGEVVSCGGNEATGPTFDISEPSTGANNLSGSPWMSQDGVLLGTTRGPGDAGGLKAVALGPLMERLVKTWGDKGKNARSVEDFLREEAGIEKNIWNRLVFE